MRVVNGRKVLDKSPQGTDHPAGPFRECLVLLELPPQAQPVYLVVTGLQSQIAPGKWDTGDMDYFYEEHTCPLNVLNDAELVFTGGEMDPHGLFRLAGVLTADDVPDDFSLDGLGQAELLAAFGADGESTEKT